MSVAAFSRPLETTALPEAALRFDDHSSPWCTICEVRSPDRRGLLQNLGAAMAGAGVNVHASRPVTIDGVAVDRFELSDRHGRKLDDALKRAATDAVHNGVVRKAKRIPSTTPPIQRSRARRVPSSSTDA
jgi:UTP:GlnB (protein PII) uridylyltransferase